MRTIFLADAHLVSSNDYNFRLLIHFLHELEGRIDALYVMGDLFDFWLGFPSQPFAEYNEILDALERLVQSGCRLVYFEGNHDFHLGEVFASRLKAEIHTGPIIESVQGKRLYLCHGDQINRDDRNYQILRSLLHSKIVASAVRHFPVTWALEIRKTLQKRSRSGYAAKISKWNYRKIITDFASSLQEQNCDGFVTGHFHLAIDEKIPESTFDIIALGDWIEQFTYGEMVDGKLRLMKYETSNTIS